MQEEIAKLDIESQKLEEDAVQVMQSYGLNLVTLDQNQRDRWFDLFGKVNEDSLDKLYNREFYTQIRDLLDDFRE